MSTEQSSPSTPITLRPYQEHFVAMMRKAFKKHKHVLGIAAQGSGKCLGKGTKVLMYDGSIKNVEDIVVGDIIMGSNSAPRNVMSTTSGSEMMYKINPTKGESFTCNESHILSLVGSTKTSRCDKNEIVNVALKDYINWGSDARNRALLYRSKIDFKHVDVKIDPWLLGIWLADGTKTNAAPVIYVNSNDVEIIDELAKYSTSSKEDNIRGTCKRISLGNPSTGCKENIFRSEFRKCLKNNDHYDVGIPDEYKINSRENRLRLLAGILDGDAYISSNYYEISTKFDRLNDDILFLSRSLGMAAYSRLKYVNGVPYHRITISGELGDIPNILTRKKAHARLQKKNALRTGFNAECIGIGDYYGFEIDGDGLFVLGDFTVTHNTVCFSYMAKSSTSRGYKVLILSNRAKLLRQSGGSLAKFGIKAEYISAQHKSVPAGNCIVAMAQTLRKRYMLSEYQELLKSIDLLIIDEIHQQDFNFLLESGIFNSKWVLGVTATAKRTGGQRQLGLDFEVMIEGLDVQTGIDLGFLVPAKHYTLDAPDLSTVEIESLTGDYKSSDLYQVFSRPNVFGGVIREFKRLGKMEKTICFCCNQIHAIETCVEFNKAGISSKFVISGLKKNDENYHILENNLHLTGDKETIEEEFDRGEFIVLCNVAIYTTGFDCIGIRNVILNRATLSEPLHDQILGRGSRIDPANGKQFFRVMDFGDNISRHGLFERKRQYSLWHDTKAGGGVAATKECPPLKEDKNGKVGCGRLVHISYPVCPFCQYVFKTPEEIKELELIEIIGGKFEFKTMTAIELKAYAELHGYDIRWVYRQLWVANTEKDFRKAMKTLGYSQKFIYLTILRLKVAK